VDQFSRWPKRQRNQLKALARKLLGTPKHLRLLDGDADVFGDGSVTLVSTPGHTPGSQSLLVHLKNSGFIILSGDVVHLEENFEKDTVPSLNTDKAASIASMDRIRRMIATYKAKLFINHDKAQSDATKAAPGILRLMSPSARSSPYSDAGERPADTEENYGSSKFSDSCGGVDRWSSCAN
jgi:Zn-dependent hydrolases, including glyoxylases